MIYGKLLNQPRESFYMADSVYPYKYSGVNRTPDQWSTAVLEIKKTVDNIIQQIQPGHMPLNAVLGNKYKDGNDKIGKHSDDEIDLEPNAFIASVSFGAERNFIFRNKKTNEKVTITLASGSILLMGENCQTNWTHEIQQEKNVLHPRINLTFRSVKKKSKCIRPGHTGPDQ